MAIRDYTCQNCQKDFTYFHVNSTDLIPECPKCGSKADPEKDRVQVPYSTSFQLKGKNWAKDRYGK
jgi:putative FmdB family regulatory protein